MTLQEIRESQPDYQMVLLLSNNNKVIITNDDFEPNSVFVRRSRTRLSLQFYIVIDSTNFKIYRTYRGTGLCDYVVYLSSEYELIESYRKKRTYKSIIKDTVKRKYLTKSDKDNTVRVKFNMVSPESFYWTVEHPDLFWASTVYKLNKTCPYWFMPYAKVMVALNVLSREDQCGHYNKIVVYANKGEEGITKLVNGQWKARAAMTKYYRDSMLSIKNKLKENNVSIMFRYE